MKNTLKMLAALSLCLLSLPAFPQSKLSSTLSEAPHAEAQSSRSVDHIVVVINQEIITRAELNEKVRTTELRLYKQNINVPPRAELEKKVLDQLITERLLLQQAKAQGIKIDDLTLDRTISRMAEQNQLTLSAMRDQVEQGGTSFAKFREGLREEIAMTRLREREIDNRVSITEGEVESFLAQERASVQQGEFHLAQILIRFPENATAAQVDQVRQRAQAAYAEVNAGGDITQIANRYIDASDKDTVNLGFRTLDRLPQLFVDAVSDLKIGQTAAPFKSSGAYHVLKLLDKRSADTIQQTHARHILIKFTPNVTKVEATRRINDLRSRIRNGLDFAEAARQHSNDGSATKGGDLGWLFPGDTVPEFERAMDALAVNELSEVVISPFGAHLIQVLERKIDEVTPDRKRAVARQTLRDKKSEELSADWLRGLRETAYIEFRH